MPALEFNPWPAVISVVLALAGWALGWLLYGRVPERSRAKDPLLRLGPVWTLLNRKYYVDEIYNATVVRFTIWFAGLNALIDQYLVDGLVNFAGVVGNWFSRVNGWIDTYIVDGAVNLVAFVNTEASRALRLLQTGRVQQYLLVVFFGLLFLVGAVVF
jgi:NADH-quinone oxidoreductase subunit L